MTGFNLPPGCGLTPGEEDVHIHPLSEELHARLEDAGLDNKRIAALIEPLDTAIANIYEAIRWTSEDAPTANPSTPTHPESAARQEADSTYTKAELLGLVKFARVELAKVNARLEEVFAACERDTAPQPAPAQSATSENDNE